MIGNESDNFHSSHEDLEMLTESFMQARYGVENCDRMDLNRVQNAWKKLRRELRNNRKRPEA